MLNHKTDRLVIGFDCSDKDDTYLLVMRETEGVTSVVNSFSDDCAEDLYTILMGNDDWKGER